MSHNPKFKVGDIVVSTAGKMPFRLTGLPMGGYYNNKYSGIYLHNGKPASSRSVKLYEEMEDTQETMQSKTLYTFTDESGKALFGTHIGTNSENKFIIEIKGTGEIVVKDQKDLEEVLPFTFSVSSSGAETHYIGEPGKLQKGDILLAGSGSSYQIVTVTAVDTKNKQARSKFKGRRLVTEEI